MSFPISDFLGVQGKLGKENFLYAGGEFEACFFETRWSPGWHIFLIPRICFFEILPRICIYLEPHMSYPLCVDVDIPSNHGKDYFLYEGGELKACNFNRI